MCSLTLQRYAHYNAEDAVQELHCRHPQSALLSLSSDGLSPSSLTITLVSVITSLKVFLHGTSLGATRLRLHLLDAVSGSVALSAQLCLEQLTNFISAMLAGELDDRIAPWFARTPLTALEEIRRSPPHRCWQSFLTPCRQTLL